ncbi:MAG: methylmalonyl-CoA mutase family protein, partial [Sulfobacillus sp.]
IALRTQQIIAHEAGVARTVDPLGGSYFVEALTDEMERQVEVYLEEIDRLGGVLACIDGGYFQREIADAAYRYQQETDSGERIVVGVNGFTEDGETQPIDLLRIDPAIEQQQIDRVKAYKASRKPKAVADSLEALKGAAAIADAPLMPVIVGAVRAEATLGEICGALKEVFGTYRERPVF